MTSKARYTLSQGFEVISPQSAPAYPILCTEWKLLKKKIQEIKTSFDSYHTLGSIILGAGISTVLSNLVTAYTQIDLVSPQVDGEKSVVSIPWVIAIATIVIGALMLHFAKQTKGVSEKQSSEVIEFMALIESRFPQEE